MTDMAPPNRPEGHDAARIHRWGFVRAANTGTIIGLRLWRLSAMSASVGWVDYYRSGYVVRWGRHKLVFVPMTGWKGTYAN